MKRFLGVLGAIGFVVACGGEPDEVDAGVSERDGGGDVSGPDASLLMDAGVPDAGAITCDRACEVVEIAAGLSHTCVRIAHGGVLCWGTNEGGQAGDGRARHGSNCAPAGSTEPEDCTGPVAVVDLDEATRLSARGGLSTCAISGVDESIRCWGLASVSPMMGSTLLAERFRPEEIAGLAPATDVSNGWVTSCSVTQGQVRCLGNNQSGQIGNGDTQEVRVPYILPSPVDVVEVETAPMGDFTCARTSTDEIYCWGNNRSFQLGDGLTHDSCMGSVSTYDCSLRPVAADAAGLGTIDLTLGLRHACLLDGDGMARCWGENAFGQLGVGDTTFRATPTPVPGLPPLAEIRAGARATCARDRLGQVWCWGGNEFGTLGDGQWDHGQTCVSGSVRVDCALEPQAVVGLDDAVHLDLGWKHACALRPDDPSAQVAGRNLWCWGQNDRRQLGAGVGREPRNEPVRVQGLELLL